MNVNDDKIMKLYRGGNLMRAGIAEAQIVEYIEQRLKKDIVEAVEKEYADYRADKQPPKKTMWKNLVNRFKASNE